MSIVDISNSAAPIELSSLDTPGDGNAITVSNGYAYVADGLQGVRVIDIANFSAPIETNYIPTNRWALDVLIFGNYLYIAEETDGLLIYDISNPLEPLPAGSLTMPGAARNMALVDNYLLLADDYKGLRIFDISNPTYPQEISFVEQIGYISNVSVFWPYAYVSDWFNADLYVIDISDLEQPTKVGIFDPFEVVHGLYGVAVVNNQAFVSMAERGMYNLDVSNPHTPTRLGVYNPLGIPSDLAIWQNYLYVSNRDVVAIDITNPRLPVVHGTTTNDGDTHSAGAYAGYAYANFGAYPTQVYITDFRNPDAPIFAGSFETHGSMNKMKVYAGYGYLAVDGLQILDLTDPSSPLVMGTYVAYNHVSSLAVQGDYVYLADGQNLRIINASDKYNPYSVGLIGVAEEVKEVDVEGNYVYAAWTNYNFEGGGVSIIDVSDPALPVEVSRISTTRGALGIVVQNNILYVGAGSQGLLMYDVSDKSNPVKTGYFANGFGGVLSNKDNVLYMSAETGGVFIFTPEFSTISGIVKGPNNAPIPGVSIQTQHETVITGQDGKFQFINQLPGTYTLTPVDPLGVYVPPQRSVSVPPDQINQAFHMLPGPVSVDVIPGITTTLSYIDLQGMPTQLVFPSDAVTETVTATLTPILPTHRAGFSYTGHTFDLTIEQDGFPIPGFTFNQPVDVSILYTDYDVRGVSDEGALTVWWIFDTIWQDASESCSPPTAYARDVVGNQIWVPVCRSGVFTLMGPAQSLFLPLILFTK